VQRSDGVGLGGGLVGQRFRNDDDEPMAARGMGAIYTRFSTGEPLRVLGETERGRLMNAYYDPHHTKLENAAADALKRFDRCLIIDVHSFSSTPLPHEPDQTIPRPELCIGFDRFHSPFDDPAEVWRICKENRFSLDLNRPFSGSIVPHRYWNADQRVRSFMREIGRDLYMVEATGLKRTNFSAFACQLCGLIEVLARP
jgi:N-formylglutamate amidohydrolase